jgi:pentatricopeptide repeat protein
VQKLTSFNSLLYAVSDNLRMGSALQIFDKMLERNLPLKKKASMKLLENLARTRYTQDVLRVRTVCEKAGIQSFIYVSEAVERELERAGQLAAH